MLGMEKTTLRRKRNALGYQPLQPKAGHSVGRMSWWGKTLRWGSVEFTRSLEMQISSTPRSLRNQGWRIITASYLLENSAVLWPNSCTFFRLRYRAWKISVLQLGQACLFVWLIWVCNFAIAYSRSHSSLYQEERTSVATQISQIPDCRGNIFLKVAYPEITDTSRSTMHRSLLHCVILADSHTSNNSKN